MTGMKLFGMVPIVIGIFCLSCGGFDDSTKKMPLTDEAREDENPLSVKAVSSKGTGNGDFPPHWAERSEPGPKLFLLVEAVSLPGEDRSLPVVLKVRTLYGKLVGLKALVDGNVIDGARAGKSPSAGDEWLITIPARYLSAGANRVTILGLDSRGKGRTVSRSVHRGASTAVDAKEFEALNLEESRSFRKDFAIYNTIHL